LRVLGTGCAQGTEAVLLVFGSGHVWDRIFVTK
jgi:hypothetical protein